MSELEEVAETLKPGSMIVHCCAVCKSYGKGVTLYNVLLTDGRRSQVCQDHVNAFTRIL
jgi:hypothetical protein